MVKLTKKFKEVPLNTTFIFPANSQGVEYTKLIRDGGCKCQPNSQRNDGSGEKIYVGSNDDVHVFI